LFSIHLNRSYKHPHHLTNLVVIVVVVNVVVNVVVFIIASPVASQRARDAEQPRPNVLGHERYRRARLTVDVATVVVVTTTTTTPGRRRHRPATRARLVRGATASDGSCYACTPVHTTMSRRVGGLGDDRATW
jgi:heme/copper-type cytochrome/quinol oxidase subunit 2